MRACILCGLPRYVGLGWYSHGDPYPPFWALSLLRTAQRFTCGGALPAQGATTCPHPMNVVHLVLASCSVITHFPRLCTPSGRAVTLLVKPVALVALLMRCIFVFCIGTLPNHCRCTPHRIGTSPACSASTFAMCITAHRTVYFCLGIPGSASGLAPTPAGALLLLLPISTAMASDAPATSVEVDTTV